MARIKKSKAALEFLRRYGRAMFYYAYSSSVSGFPTKRLVCLPAVINHEGRAIAPMPFPFLSLPAELRVKIYEYALITSRNIILPTKSEPHQRLHISLALLRVSKQVHDEASAVLYGKNLFVFRFGALKEIKTHWDGTYPTSPVDEDSVHLQDSRAISTNLSPGMIKLIRKCHVSIRLPDAVFRNVPSSRHWRNREIAAFPEFARDLKRVRKQLDEFYHMLGGATSNLKHMSVGNAKGHFDFEHRPSYAVFLRTARILCHYFLEPLAQFRGLKYANVTGLQDIAFSKKLATVMKWEHGKELDKIHYGGMYKRRKANSRKTILVAVGRKSTEPMYDWDSGELADIKKGAKRKK